MIVRGAAVWFRDSPWVIAGVALSIGLVALAPWVWRHRGVADGLRWTAIAIIPAALVMSGMATMVGRIGLEIGRFVTSFAFSPVVWAGIALFGGAVGLELASRAMRARGMGARPPGDGAGAKGSIAGRRTGSAQIEPSRNTRGSRAAPVDDDMADIEELLRRRGIT